MGSYRVRSSNLLTNFMHEYFQFYHKKVKNEKKFHKMKFTIKLIKGNTNLSRIRVKSYV